MKQNGRVMTLWSRVTAPLRARARPSMVALVRTEIDCSAMIVPLKDVFVSSVAELPTCQKTLHAWAPLMRATVAEGPVIRVSAIWKMKTALGSPCASRVRVPVMPIGPEAKYTPEFRVWPTRSPAMLASGARLVASR